MAFTITVSVLLGIIDSLPVAVSSPGEQDWFFSARNYAPFSSRLVAWVVLTLVMLLNGCLVHGSTG